MNPREEKICFDKVRMLKWSMYINAAFPSREIEALVAPEDFNGVRGPFEEVTASKFARVYKGAISFKGRIANLYVKHYLYRSAVDFLKHLFRPSRAMRSLKASQMLAAENLLSPEVIAMGQRRFGTIVTKSFLITRSVENAPTLTTWIANNTELKTKRKFIRLLGETIGKMHAANISHGDLRTGNVLAKENDGDWDFYFLDNERTVKYKTLPDKLRHKNLVQLNMLRDKNITNTDRARFYKSYAKKNEGTIQNPKDLAKKVITRTKERLKKKQKPEAQAQG
jgi:tRNA A-37 threonylcarbamoyl transferase component Bud32